MDHLRSILKTQSENDRREIIGQNEMEKYLSGIKWIIFFFFFEKLLSEWIEDEKTKKMNLKSRMLQKKEERESGYWLRSYGENWIIIKVIFIRQ